MVLPEGTESRSRRPGSGRTLLFVAAIAAIALGFMALGALSSSDRLAVEVSTTTSTTIGDPPPPIDPDNFSIAQIATGERFDWKMTGEFDGHPLGLIEHDDHVLLFTGRASGGLEVARSADGSTWEEPTQVIDNDYAVSEIKSTTRGLIAVGHRKADNTLIVWTSEDAFEWTFDEVPTSTGSPYLTLWATAVAATEETMIIAAITELDTPSLVQDHLHEAGVDIDVSRVSWQVDWAGEEGHVLRLSGPLGLEVTEMPLAYLDLTDDEWEWLANGFSGTPHADIWVKEGIAGWQRSSIEGTDTITSIVTLPDAGFRVFGFGPIGPVAHQSPDGVTWTPVIADSTPGAVDIWQDYMVGLANSLRPEVLVSEDGTAWEKLGLADHFPLPISWAATAIGPGDEGLAVAIQGWEQSEPERNAELPVVMLDNGNTLILDFENDVFILETETDTYTWDMALAADRRSTPEGVELDLNDGKVRFLGPETREPLAELDVADLEEAQHEYFGARFESNRHSAFAFTNDGIGWTIQDFSPIVGDSYLIGGLQVAAGHVSAMVVSGNQVSIGPSTIRSAGATFQLWTAEIP